MKKIVSLILATMMLLMLPGCKKESQKKANIDLSSYPIETEVTLTYWMPLPANVSASVSNFGDTEYAKELEKRTGVKIKYIHPALGQEVEALNLMIASNELPDIIETNWLTAISGGPQAAIANNVIIPLNDIVEEYAPAFSEYVSTEKDIAREIKSDDGVLYAFPFVRGEENLLVSSGLIIRKDWLDDLNLPVPETTEDWEKTLKAFRDEKGATAPVSINNVKNLLAMTNSTNGFYVDGEEIKFGPIEDGFKESLVTLNRWYDEGLLDKNYAMLNSTMIDSNVLNGFAGVVHGSGGSGIGKWMNSKPDSKFELMAVAMPLESDGTPNRFSAVSNPYPGYGSAAITTACKYPELAAKVLDFNYTEEGRTLANFGVEGKSYSWENDYPKYTDFIMNNPDGLPVSQAMSMYIRGNESGPFVQDSRYIEQYYSLPQQKSALEIWGKAANKAKTANIPAMTMTADEAAEYSSIYNDINKYCAENINAFITGNKPLSKFDTFVKDINKMGIDKAIQLQQSAYDRYLKRK